jgi:hypothetical protein
MDHNPHVLLKLISDLELSYSYDRTLYMLHVEPIIFMIILLD